MTEKALMAEFDEDGYPTEACLDSIERHDGDEKELLQFMCGVWRKPGYAAEVAPGEFIFSIDGPANAYLWDAMMSSDTWRFRIWPLHEYLELREGFLWVAISDEAKEELKKVCEEIKQRAMAGVENDSPDEEEPHGRLEPYVGWDIPNRWR